MLDELGRYLGKCAPRLGKPLRLGRPRATRAIAFHTQTRTHKHEHANTRKREHANARTRSMQRDASTQAAAATPKPPPPARAATAALRPTAHRSAQQARPATARGSMTRAGRCSVSVPRQPKHPPARDEEGRRIPRGGEARRAHATRKGNRPPRLRRRLRARCPAAPCAPGLQAGPRIGPRPRGRRPSHRRNRAQRAARSLRPVPHGDTAAPESLGVRNGVVRRPSKTHLLRAQRAQERGPT